MLVRTVDPPLTEKRRRDIQGLRGLAVLMVVAYHAALPFPGGFLGVDVFFVISGFVIASMLLRELSVYARIDFAAFYARRVRRLLPALSVVVASSVVFSVLLPSPLGQPQETIKTAIGAMALSANIVLQRSVPGYFALAAKDNPLLHTWSLSVEEQFYLVFPAVMAIAWSVGRRRDIAAGGAGMALAGVALVSGGVVLYAHGFPAAPGAARNFLFFSAVTRAWEFVAGALLALAWRRMSITPARGAALLLGGLACLAWSALAATDQGLFPNGWALLAVAGTLMAIAAGGAPAQRWNPLMVTPIARIGDWSYSWYLWHWPFIAFSAQIFERSRGGAAVAALLSLVPAVASYVFVEQPVRTSTRLGARGSYALLAGLVLATVAVSFAVERAVHFGWGQPWSMGAHAAMQRNCDEQPVDFEACTWEPPAAHGSVLLVGDSQAWALADGVIASAAGLGLSTTVATMNGCPFVEPAAAAAVSGPACGAAIARTLDLIRRRPPDVLLIANSEHYDAPVLDGYRRLPAVLSAGSPRVVVVRQPPRGDRLSGRRSILVNRSGPFRSSPVAAPNAQLGDVLSELGDAVEVLDPRDTFCSGLQCDVAADGMELYSNTDHLSVAGALRLVPQLTQALRSAAPAR